MSAVDKALKILMLFADAERPLGVIDISARMGLSKSYASRALKTLRENGFLEQDTATRKYSIGINAFAFAAGYPRQNSLAQTVWPHMREISQATQHTIFLSIRNGDHCRHVMAVEGNKFWESQWRVGIRLPMHSTASGKLLWAFLDKVSQSELFNELELTSFTENTIVDPGCLRRQLQNARRDGFAVARGETVRGLAAVSVPVLGKQGAALGALGIVSPDSMLTEGDLSLAVPLLWAHAAIASSTLGARIYPYRG